MLQVRARRRRRACARCSTRHGLGDACTRARARRSAAIAIASARDGRDACSTSARSVAARHLVGDDARACRRCATTRPAPTRSRRRASTRAIPGCRSHADVRPRRRRRGAVRARGGARPRVAILREQGVNGQIEMAAAFDRAGFEAVDVHMTDLLDGRVDLAELPRRWSRAAASRTATCSAPARAGRSRSCSTPRARDAFAAFFARTRHVRARRVQRLPDAGGARAS